MAGEMIAGIFPERDPTRFFTFRSSTLTMNLKVSMIIPRVRIPQRIMVCLELKGELCATSKFSNMITGGKSKAHFCTTLSWRASESIA